MDSKLTLEELELQTHELKEVCVGCPEGKRRIASCMLLCVD